MTNVQADGIEAMAKRYWYKSVTDKSEPNLWENTREDNRQFCRDYVRDEYLPWVTEYLSADSPKRESGILTDEDKREIVKLMIGRAEAMGDISMVRNMGNALSAILSDPRFEVRRKP